MNSQSNTTMNYFNAIMIWLVVCLEGRGGGGGGEGKLVQKLVVIGATNYCSDQTSLPRFRRDLDIPSWYFRVHFLIS